MNQPAEQPAQKNITKRLGPKESAEACRIAILKLLPELRSAIASGEVTQASSIGSKVSELFELAHSRFPALHSDPDLKIAYRLVSRLRRAGCISAKHRHFLAGAPGLGKRR